MIKKFSIFILSLCLLFSANCYAENTDQSETTPAPPAGEARGEFPDRQGGAQRRIPAENNVPDRIPAENKPAEATEDNALMPSESSDSKESQPDVSEDISDTDNLPDEIPESEAPVPEFQGEGFPERPNSGRAPFEHDIQEPDVLKVGSFDDFLDVYLTPIISVLALIFAFIFVILYKRKHY